MGWVAAAATRRGEAHARRGERAQDALRLILRGRVLIAAVADGAGSAPRGGAGAALAVRALTGAARAALADRPLAALTDADLLACFEAARARLTAAAAVRGLTPRDLATTALLALSDGETTLAGHVGDGAAVARDAEGRWRALSWPAAGEHAGATFFLTDEALAFRAVRLDATVTALALLTDGLERLTLDFAAAAPHAPFFDRMAAPLAALAAPGRDAALSRALGAWLASEPVAARTDDDRTLLLAALP